MVVAAYFQSIEKTEFSNVVTLCRGLIFVVIGLFVLPKVLKVNGIWLTAPVAELLTVFLCWFLLEMQKSEANKLILEEIA